MDRESEANRRWLTLTAWLATWLTACTPTCPPPTTCTVYCFSEDGYRAITAAQYLDTPLDATYRCEAEFDYLRELEGCWSVDCDCR